MPREKSIHLVDCPRDAIQGIHTIIPTARKIDYINSLIETGLFDFIDFGSFVSSKAVPQMADTDAVLAGIVKNEHTKLIAIIANEQGARQGKLYDKIDYLGYPFSVSDTFQRRNTNRSTEYAYLSVLNCKELLMDVRCDLMVYLSMAFGNPYGDIWHPEIVMEWVDKLVRIGIGKFSVADTTASADPEGIAQLFAMLFAEYPQVEWSIHLHSRADGAMAKIEAAFSAGCRIFEGAVMGYGGCPFAQDDLVGNIPTELLLRRFRQQDELLTQDLLENFQKLIRHAV